MRLSSSFVTFVTCSAQAVGLKQARSLAQGVLGRSFVSCFRSYLHVPSLKKKGSFYQACVRPVLLYGSETWQVKEEDLVREHLTEMSMLRWMSHVIFKDRIPSKDLLTKFDLLPVRRVVQRNRLPWFSHVIRMDNDNWVKKCMMLEVNGRRDPGRPKKTWEQVIYELGVTRSLVQDRLNWRKSIVMNSLTHANME